MADFINFRAEVRKQLDLRDWKYKDLARETNYSVYSIYSALEDNNCSYNLRKRILDVLGLPETLVR